MCFYSNGPLGSAMCAFSFGELKNDLERVFQTSYLVRFGQNQYAKLANSNPFTVSKEGGREGYGGKGGEGAGVLDGSGLLRVVHRITSLYLHLPPPLPSLPTLPSLLSLPPVHAVPPRK